MNEPDFTVSRQPTPDDGRSRILLHMPVGVKSVSLVVLATLAFIYMLNWAADVFVPVMMGVMLSYTLAPVIERLHRWRIPRAIGAVVVLLALLGGAVWMTTALRGQATMLIESLPQAAQKLRLAMRGESRHAGDSPIEKMQKAANELERAATESSVGAPASLRGATRVVIQQSPFSVTEYLWTGTLGLMALLGKTLMVFLIAYFLLASGNNFRRKLVRLSGTTLSAKKVTVQALDEIQDQIQRYLLVQVLTSAIVGVCTWLAFLAIGLQNAAVWGVVAGVTNLVPYLGGAFVAGLSALLGFMQFGTIEMALLVGGSAVVIHGLVGYLLLPWLTSRLGQMNAVAVFIGVLAWGWLWGLPGLLLGMPILMMAKAVCDRVEDLKPVGELLGS